MTTKTESDVLAVLRAFLLANLPAGTEVIRTQANKVPAPKSPNWVAMTPMGRDRLATNINTWDATLNPPVATDHMQKVKLRIGLDFYGASGADFATTISTLWRDDYAYQYFQNVDTDLAPLDATDGQQLPLISGEEQWVERWRNELSLQANLDVSTNQDFMATVTVGLINVDAAYPPGA